MKVAAIQYKPVREQFDYSWDRLKILIEQAIVQGAQLIVCPEMTLSGYLFKDAHHVSCVAELMYGKSYYLLAALAKKHGVMIIQGYPERVDPGIFFNSARVIGTQGELVYNYRKNLLYSSDTYWAQTGHTPYPLIPTVAGLLTVAICMDLNDDTLLRFLEQQKPRIFAFCTNWLQENADMHAYWRMRLHGLPCYFIAANTYGEEIVPPHLPTRFAGQSVIWSPDGQVLACASADLDQVLVAEIKDI